jgi:hypothetical protein
MKFKTRMINAAVAAALGTVAGAAQAVNLVTENAGQVLIYPYYTVQSVGGNPYDTYISIVNTDSNNGKAVKIRFLEGKASKEVLDFNLYLSPNDMWTAAITRDGSGNPILRTTDNSCTVPPLTPVNTTGTVVTREQAFVNFAYASDNVKDSTLARAKEGYVEAIIMADLVSGRLNAAGRDTFADALHNSSSVPANCAGIASSWLSNAFTNTVDGIGASGVALPTGTLSGAETLINVNNGLDISADAVAMTHFTEQTLHYPPSTTLPSLGEVNPKTSVVLNGDTMVTTNWGVQAPNAVPVTAALMRDQVVNEYVWGTDANGVGFGTDWVITMPTKGFHVGTTITTATQPFSSTLTTTGACEAVSLTTYNREEQSSTALAFSPPGQGSNLCWEVSVISWGTSNVLGGVTTRQTISTGFQSGWIRMAFAQKLVNANNLTYKTTFYGAGGPVTSPANAGTYTGLPVVGFSAATFLNGSSLAAYGSAYVHRYSRNITP